MLTESQRDLDQKSAKPTLAQREVDHLRDQLNNHGIEVSSSGNIEHVANEVKQFETEIARPCQRNDEQTRKLEKLGARVTVANVKPPAGTRNHRTPSIPEADEVKEKSPSSLPPRVSPVETGKISDRYANAVASGSSHAQSFTTPGMTTSSEVVQLIKKFSAQGSDDGNPRPSPSGVAFNI
ncbi:hypothetical protein PHYPSEUDO_007794 [Phytophthora pseudosyringae]|uniref:Uncharacterized protein n=1 Tax=Phytophthora pseudosyringae TaxID=221518 RepID=A0A8T1VIU1_9STRA|nr:hypothetical protein PHYPSEUDO_007794 [Phytophthora pseudosyringae]